MKEPSPREEAQRGKTRQKSKSSKKPGQLLAFLDSSSDPIFSLDSRSKIQFANEAMQNLTGLSVEGLMGLNCQGELPKQATIDKQNWLTYALAPPAPSGEEQIYRKRILPFEKEKQLVWEIQFFPLGQQGKNDGFLAKVSTIPIQSPQMRLIPDKVLDLVAKQEDWDKLYFDQFASAEKERVEKQFALAREGKFPVSFIGGNGEERKLLGRLLCNSIKRMASMAFLDCAILPVPVIESAMGLGSARLRAGEPDFIFLNNPHLLPLAMQEKIAGEIPCGPESLARDAPRYLIGAPEFSQILESKLFSKLLLTMSLFQIRVPVWKPETVGFTNLASKLTLAIHDSSAKSPVHFAPNTMELLQDYSWPGGWVEFVNVIATLSVKSKNQEVEKLQLPLHIREPDLHLPKNVRNEKLPLGEILAKVEGRLMSMALARSNGNRTKAASILGIWRPRLIRRLESLGLPNTPKDKKEDNLSEENLE